MHRNLNLLWHVITTYLGKQEKDAAGTISMQEKLWSKDFFVISLLNFLMQLSEKMLLGIFPFYIISLGGDNVVIGVAASIYAVVCMITRPIAGWILDNKSRSIVFIVAMLIMATLPPLYLLFSALPAALMLRGGNGFAWSAAGTATNTIACDVIPKSRFGEGVGIFGLTSSLAIVTGPAIGIFLWNSAGINPLFISITVIGFLSFWIACRFPFHKVDLSKAKTAGEKEQGAHPIPIHKRLAHLFDKRAMPASVLLLLMYFPAGAVTSFVALFCVESGYGSGGLTFTLQALGTAMIRVFAGKFSDKKGEGPSVYISSSLYILSFILMLFGNSAFLFYVGSYTYGLATGIILPALQAMSLRIVPMERRGAASSTYLCCFDLSQVVGGLSGGLLAGLFGYQIMFCFMSIGYFLCILVYRTWASKTMASYHTYHKMAKKEGA